MRPSVALDMKRDAVRRAVKLSLTANPRIPCQGFSRGGTGISENRLPDYLDHIRKAAGDTISVVDGVTKTDFLVDKRTHQAVVMSLIIIGEAASKSMHGAPLFTIKMQLTENMKNTNQKPAIKAAGELVRGVASHAHGRGQQGIPPTRPHRPPRAR